MTNDEAQAIVAGLPKFADGTPIVGPGWCYTPDGRLAYVEPFAETPVARIKHETDGDLDDYWDARQCYQESPEPGLSYKEARARAKRPGGVQGLLQVAQADATVASFVKAWQSGCCASFENMLCQLVLHLASEKQRLMRAALKAAQLAPPPDPPCPPGPLNPHP